MDPIDDRTQSIKEIFAGSIGGVLQVLSGQPFDCIKVRMQTQPTSPPLYSNAIDCLNKTVKNEGLAGLYKGTLTPLIGIGACVSIQFSMLEQTKRVFQRPGQSLNTDQLYMAGGISGISNSILSGPIEHIRTRLQTQSIMQGARAYKGPMDCIRQIYNHFGISGIYKAQSVTMVREFHGYGVYFLTYEYLIQSKCRDLGLERTKLPITDVMMFGALAGNALWFSIFPVDLIKSKLQTDSLEVQSRKYRSALDCFQQVIKNDGLRGLYRGFGPCILRAAPVNAITFIGYELAMKSMKVYSI